MTVCVATIGGGQIFGASDRMLTAGDVQFSPPSEKTFPLTTSIVAMVAGDMAIHAELLGLVRNTVNDTLKLMEVPRWLTVKEVADWYAWYYSDVRARVAETRLLKPLGLTRSTFLEKQNELSPALLEKLARELLTFSLPPTEVIIAGIDESGPHIYTVAEGQATCRDLVGFAAIGSGANHANSYLMFSAHNARASAAVTVLRTFTAKKRAEVAPGVGSDTDIYVIGPQVGSYNQLRKDIEQKLDAIYAKAAAGHKKADQRAEGEINVFVEGLARAVERLPQQSVPEIDHRDSPPADESDRAHVVGHRDRVPEAGPDGSAPPQSELPGQG